MGHPGKIFDKTKKSHMTNHTLINNYKLLQGKDLQECLINTLKEETLTSDDRVFCSKLGDKTFVRI